MSEKAIDKLNDKINGRINNERFADPLSYYKILDDIQRFKESGGPNCDEFSFFDSPSHKYYKIMFYFGTNSEENRSTINIDINDNQFSGLLAPAWELGSLPDKIGNTNVKNYNKLQVDTSNGNSTNEFYSNEAVLLDQKYNYDAIKNTTEYSLALEDDEYHGTNTAGEMLEKYKNFVDKNNELMYNTYTKGTKNTAHLPWYWSNSAYAYLMLNDEEDRAKRLKDFINLLSNISANAPWYFSNVTGVAEALTRKVVDDRKPEFSERKKLSITCLPDAFDNRIGNLLDLYRSVVWDWKNKREVVPANLRKFDMAIYIFEAPDTTWHKTDQTYWQELGESWVNALENSLDAMGANRLAEMVSDETKKYTTIGSEKINTKDAVILEKKNDLLKNYKFAPSYKLIEFHDCEFEYNSSATAWTKLDNQMGVAPTYTIDISYGDSYELTYNDLLMERFGDIVKSSTWEWRNTQQALLENRLTEDGWGAKLGEGLFNRANNMVMDAVKHFALGNLYGFSLTNMASQIQNGIQNPMAAYDTMTNYVLNGKEMVSETKKQFEGYGNTYKNMAHNSIGMNMFNNEYKDNGLTSKAEFDALTLNSTNPNTEIPSQTQSQRTYKDDRTVYAKLIANNLGSDNNIADNNILTNNARQELGSDNNIADNNIFTNDARQELGSDNNIADNNILEKQETTFTMGSLFEYYTKSKVLGSKTSNLGNIHRQSISVNNL